jgi:hypothetical protein
MKEKGFDWNTDKQFNLDKIVGDYNITDRSRYPERYLDAPTLQMAMKWLREKYNIFTTVTSGREQGNGNPFYRAWWERLDDIAYRYPVNEQHEYITYEDACEAAIKYCLENLI